MKFKLSTDKAIINTIKEGKETTLYWKNVFNELKSGTVTSLDHRSRTVTLQDSDGKHTVSWDNTLIKDDES